VSLFKPFPNPFLKKIVVGPYHKNQDVTIYIQSWFSQNVQTYVAISPSFLAFVNSTLGPTLKGTVPTNAKIGTIQGTVVASNAKGSSQISFSLKLVK
jgi:hypothetical protein